MRSKLFYALAGACAGAVNGLFGAGGGMLLVPLLTLLTDTKEEEIFFTSVSIIFPICLISIAFSICSLGLPPAQSFPYLIGGALGGFLAGCTGKRIPVHWLHKGFGLLILWGGIRYLC